MYSITFTISFFAGIVSALGMVLHEFLEVIIAYVLLLRSGISERRVLWLALCAVAGVSETLCMRLSPCGFDGSFIEPFGV